MVAATVANVLVSTLWSMNASRAWIRGSWTYIPLTLATQVALIPYTDFTSVSGVLLFNLISTLPNLLVNLWLGYRGFQSLTATDARRVIFFRTRDTCRRRQGGDFPPCTRISRRACSNSPPVPSGMPWAWA